jgi:hypothetical protein
MRSRVRIQPYLSADLRQRLAAYAAAQGETETAIAEAALKKYFEPDRTDEALVIRRLDSVVQVLGRVEERLEVVGEALGRFVRFAFRLAPETLGADAVPRADGLYRAFLTSVSKAVGTGTTFLAAVRRARLPPAPAATAPPADERRQEKGGAR